MMTAIMPRESAIDMHRTRARRALSQARDASVIALGIVPNFTGLPRSAWRRAWLQECDRAAYHRRMLAVEKSYRAVAYVNCYGTHYGAVVS